MYGGGSITVYILSYDVLILTGTMEVIIAVGGEDDKVVLRSVESFDPVTHHWKTLNCLPFAVSKHGVVVSGTYYEWCSGKSYVVLSLVSVMSGVYDLGMSFQIYIKILLAVI